MAQNPDWLPFLGTVSVLRGLPADALGALAREMTEVTLQTGAILFRQGEPADAMYLLVEGRAVVYVEEAGQPPRALNMLVPGDCVGEDALAMSGSRAANVRCKVPSRLLRITTTSFEQMLGQYPVLRQVINSLVAARLPGLIDASLRADLKDHLSWIRLKRRAVLFNAGDPGDAVYVLARGRLGAFRESAGGEEMVGEIAAGEPVGEIALLTKEPRALTVKALRDSELVRLSAEGFETAMVRNPAAIVPVARTLAQRLRAVGTNTQRRTAIRVIAVLPLAAGGPVADLLREVEAGLRHCGSVLTLDSALCDELHGEHASQATVSSTVALRTTDWVGSVEGGHDYSLYRADDWASPWTWLVAGRADRILVVADGDAPPALGKLAHVIEKCDPGTVELVLLHGAGTKLPTGTAAWLKAVKPVRHHHVRAGHPDDARRVARFLTGHAVGMVFGGGGARGYAHAGVVRALIEHQVTVDFVGGVSMGSLPAAVMGMGGGYEEVMDAYRRVFVQPNRPFLPYTVPILSVFDMRKGERALQSVFGDIQIEDLWLNYFCVATDITAAQAKIFREGPLWRAMRASGTFPGLFPPLPVDGHLLVDGGLFGNLPVEPMFRLCPGPIMACDVSKDREIGVDPTLYAPPTPWQALRNKLNPFAKPLDFPGLATVLQRAIDSLEAGQRARLRQSIAFCFTPPIGKFALDQLQSLDEIAAVGYEYANRVITDLPPVIPRKDRAAPAEALRRFSSAAMPVVTG